MMNKNNQRHRLLKRKILASAIAMAYMGVLVTPVYASDTEIYIQRNDNAPISPTLMMMFDTSGSMNECVDVANGGTCEDVSKRRINVLKKAMQQILRGDSTVNPAVAAAPGYIKMGLSRYHTDNANGYVFYPARPLDAFVQLNPDGYVTARGLTGSSDAIQNPALNLSSTQLIIGSNGSINNIAGLQFSQLRIPKGATIRRAYIELKAAASQAGYAKWRITAEDTDSAAEYSPSSLVDSRSYSTPSGADIEVPAWTSGEKYRLYVTEQVQGLVSRSTWCGDNNMAFRIAYVPTSGVTAGQRTAYSFEGAPTAEDRPTLVVDYTMDTESTTSCIMVPRTTVINITGNNDDVEWNALNASATTRAIQSNNSLSLNKYASSTLQNTTGLYYRNLPMPFGAPIDSAYLKARAYSTSSVTGVQPISVSSFDNVNLSPFCTTTSSSSCQYGNTLNTWPVNTVLPSEAIWTPLSSSLTAEGTYAITVTDAVRKVINKSGWASGQPIGFRLRHANTANNAAAFYSRNGGSSKAVQLEINWRERVTDLRNLETVRDQIEAAVVGLANPSSTPLGPAYAEAARYLYGLGASANTSVAMSPFKNGGAPADYDARVVTDPTAGSTTVKYKSPILAEDECSANYIFLLTDGEPTGGDPARNNVKTNVDGIINSGTTCSTSTSVGTAQWDCMKKLAEYNTRQNNRINKPIRTNTLILGPLDSARTNMEAVATAGQGTHYDATSTAALVQAISRTIDDAASRSGTIAAPGVAVNQISRISHLDQLYYAVFKPDTKYRWDGNLKRYRLNTTSLQVMDNSSPPQNAVDSDTGLFKEGTKSFWSLAADGAQATQGGAATNLPNPVDRKIFTYFGLSGTNAALIPMTLGTTAFDGPAKTAMGLTTSVADNIKFQNLINWYKGYGVSDLTVLADINAPSMSLRKTLGAALHSQPVLINYGYTNTGNPEDTNNPDYQKNYIFFSTLQGSLHAMDAKTGAEVFNFIPSEKLGTLEAQFENETQIIPEFGLDSTWTFYRKDKDLNGQINSGDNVYLYGGMRMGGSNYYALNVTNLTAPSLLFAIQGGSTNYPRMGQTWSQPVLATIRYSGRSRTVLIFGGGYDPRHETSAQLFTGDDLGNQIYMVDAFTGQKIWSVSGTSADGATTTTSDMKYSITASPKVVDMDGDGFADNIYVGDLGGQVFRIDINKDPSTASNVVKRVRLLAKVGQTGGTASIANQRRFYETPEVASFTDTVSGKKFVAVTLGSGYRSRPLNAQTEDHYFTLFDYDAPRKDLLGLTSTQEAQTEAAGGLQPVITKTNLTELNTSSTAAADVTNKKGWFMDFVGSGEKVLAKGNIFKSKLTFVTYLPQLGVSNCSPVVGRSRQYSMCMPYGNVCTVGQTNRLVNDNVMSGISGHPQNLVLEVPRPDGSTEFRDATITGTGGTWNGPLTINHRLESTRKWREKTRNPAQ